MGLSSSSEVLSGIDPDDYNQYLFKIVIVGDYGVGKTCLLRRFTTNQFEDAISTMGVDFAVRYLILDKNIVKLQLWDTGGQERYRRVIHSYFRDAHGVIFVYDVTRRSSFEYIEGRAKEVENVFCSCGDGINRILIGSKCDLQDEREVSYLEGKELADKLEYLFMETSSKNGRNVEQAFLALTSYLVDIEKEKRPDITPSDTIKLSENRTIIKNRLSNCCRTN